MSIPSLTEILGSTVSEGYDDTPLPIGDYNVVITGCEVRNGPKGPYLNIEATVFDGEHSRRKVWGMSSFSEKALTMPGGIAQLLQASGVGSVVDVDTPPAELPAVISAALISTPIEISVSHDHEGRPGDKKFNTDGTPKMRPQIETYSPADEAFLASFETEVEGGDDDVPF